MWTHHNSSASAAPARPCSDAHFCLWPPSQPSGSLARSRVILPASSLAHVQPQQAAWSEDWTAATRTSSPQQADARPWGSSQPLDHTATRQQHNRANSVRHSSRGMGRGGSARGRRTATPGTTEQEPAAPPPPYKVVLKPHGVVPDISSAPTRPLPTGLSITWLGTSSGSPTLERNVSCTVVRAPDSTALVDCGEGSHRQFPAAGYRLEHIDNIYITHLHGDHCYGLGAMLQAIDRAKSAAAHNDEKPTEPAPTYVWGPPGLAELVYAQLIITGAHHHLKGQVIITEFVSNPADAVLDPQPVVPECPLILIRRQPPRHMAQSATLQAAAEAVRRPLAAIPPIWTPRHGRHMRPYGTPQLPAPAAIGGDSMSDDEAELLYGGQNYVAQEGLVWDLGLPGQTQGLRCLAAQLQHRVPCWGYVMQEMQPFQAGGKRRKIVILGDTVNSAPIAPLALNCDVLAHEATFIEGMEDKCRIAQHSTAWMAGAFAHAVQAKLLVLTHFSARYHKMGEPVRANGRVMREREVSAEEEAKEQASAIRMLIAEAQAQHVRGRVLAANDFFALDVPL